jgi:hypothetical protein
MRVRHSAGIFFTSLLPRDAPRVATENITYLDDDLAF